MNGKALISIGFTGVLLLTCAPVAADPLRTPSVGRLQERVEAYYRTFERCDFGAFWAFFAPSMRQDNPKDEYVLTLRRVLGAKGKVKLVKAPLVWVEIETSGEQGEKQQPLGKVMALLNVFAGDGKFFSAAVDTTTWVWRQPSAGEEFDWYTVGGPMRSVKAVE